MSQRRVGVADIVVGEPLKWNAYGTDGKLLLRKGYIIESERQVAGLLERGLYIDASSANDARKDPIKKVDTPSVVRLLNTANKRLERLLFGISGESDAQTKVIELVKDIADATDINRNIALACIHLNQSSGSYSTRHSINTAIVSMLVMRAMHKSQEEIVNVMAAALTMNIGMLRHHDHFSSKSEPLTEKEWDIIKKHPSVGVELLKQAGVNNEAWLSHVLQHHENTDCTGYPFGTNAQTLSQNSRILSFADQYCASVSIRKYRKTLPHAAALRDVFLKGPLASDKMLAAYFIKELGPYPPGAFVLLKDGEIGVVTGNGAAPATPIVHALIGPRGAPLSLPIKRDTAKLSHGIRDYVSVEDIPSCFSLHQLWGEQAIL